MGDFHIQEQTQWLIAMPWLRDPGQFNTLEEPGLASPPTAPHHAWKMTRDTNHGPPGVQGALANYSLPPCNITSSGMYSVKSGDETSVPGSKHKGAKWRSHWPGRPMVGDMVLGEVMPTGIPRTVWNEFWRMARAGSWGEELQKR